MKDIYMEKLKDHLLMCDMPIDQIKSALDILTEAYNKGRESLVREISYIEYNLRQSIKHEREGSNIGEHKDDVDTYLTQLQALTPQHNDTIIK